MSFACLYHLAGGVHIPYPNNAIGPPAGEEATVGAEVKRVHIAAMDLERIQPLALGDIPQANRLVDPNGGEYVSIRTKSEMVNRICMADKGMESLTTTYIPQA